MKHQLSVKNGRNTRHYADRMVSARSTSPVPSLSERLQDVTEQLAAAGTQAAVFETVLRPALEALNAVAGAVLLVVGGRLELAAARPSDGSRAGSVWQAGPLESGMPATDALERHEALYFEHAGALNAAYPLLEARSGGVAQVASALLPMFTGERPLGCLALDFREPHEFTRKERRFLRTLSAQCGIALERARLSLNLERQVQERTAQLETEMRAQEAFVAFSEAVGSELDVQMLSQQALAVLGLRFPGSTGAYYQLEDDLWKLRGHTDDLYDRPELLQLLKAGLPKGTPMFLQALRSHRPTFVNGWDSAREQVQRTEDYAAVSAYPLLQVGGEVRAMLVVGLKDQTTWTERDRAVFRAVGRGLTLALDRSVQAEVMQQQNEELAARTRALEAFAQLTADLSVQRDPHALVRRAQEVALSLLPPGYALYYEREGDHWRSRVQVGDVGDAALQAFIDGGPRVGVTPSVDVPWETRQPLYQDDYARGSDTPTTMVQHVGAAASLPILIAGEPVGVLVVVLFGQRAWTHTDRAVLETVVSSLELALDRAGQARQLEEERASLETFVAFTEAASRIEQLGALTREAFMTLQALFPGSTAALYEWQEGLWKANHHTGDMQPELVKLVQAGLPPTTPIFAQLVQTQRPVFMDHWSADSEEVAHSQAFQTACLYPILQDGEICAALGVGLEQQASWSERDRTVVLAVGRSFTLLYERISTLEALAARQREAESRTQSLEAFALLTRDLGVQGDRAALVRRAQEVVLSVLGGGFAGYFEPDASRTHWRLVSGAGTLPIPALRAAIDAGLDWERTRNLWLPWTTGLPLYQDAYDRSTDGLDALLDPAQPGGATATVPLLQGPRPVGVFGVWLVGARPWRKVDRAVLEGILRSLGVALERAESVAQLAERSSDLERSNTDLRSANEELEAFAYSVSHDLRTPVRHIRGFNKLLRGALGEPLDAKAGRYLGVIEDAARRMDTLIDAMLELSRTSRQPLRSEAVDLNALTAAVQADLEPESAGRSVEWAIGALPQVQGDPATLRQVLMNLLSNALKYTRTRRPARIDVWADEQPQAWVVHVQDNGVGFDEQYAGKLFGVFQRLHRQDDFEGVGVGLANVRRIVLRHRGQVFARGKPEEGATFSFSLPKEA